MLDSIDKVVLAIADVLYQPWCVPLLLIAGGILFTIRTGFMQVRFFGESIRVVKEKPHEGVPILESLKNGEEPEISVEHEGSGVKLGVSVVTVNEQNSDYYGIPQGALVKEVEAGSAAEEAEIQAGDIITAIDDKQITSVDDLTEALSHYSDGDSAEVTIAREVKSAYGMFEGNASSYRQGKTTVTFGKADESVQNTSAANER